MNNAWKLRFLAIGAGIATGMLLLAIFNISPYLLAIGPAVALIVGKPSTLKSVIFYCVIVGVPLTIFLLILHAFPGNINSNPAGTLAEIVLMICFWALYGVVLLFIKRGWENGKPWFF
jgi:hypothetical protein